jgi:hypothetical protein
MHLRFLLTRIQVSSHRIPSGPTTCPGKGLWYCIFLLRLQRGRIDLGLTNPVLVDGTDHSLPYIP